MPRKNRLTTEGRDTQLVEAIEPCLGHISIIYANGQAMSPADLKAAIQRRIDAADRARRLRAEWIAASHEYDGVHAEVSKIVAAVKAVALNVYGGPTPDLAKLAQLGFTPPRAHVRTPEEKLVVAAKGRATRIARHTKGPKARLAITGENPTGAPLVAPPEVVVRPIGAPGAASPAGSEGRSPSGSG